MEGSCFWFLVPRCHLGAAEKTRGVTLVCGKNLRCHLVQRNISRCHLVHRGCIFTAQLPSMFSYEKLLLENKSWASGMVSEDPDFFNRLAEIQSPEFLWIGCSDSRVPANQITGTQPGEIFVHRNVANLALNTDVNLLSVLEFAVNHIKVKHIIVCGHYGCGGIKASLTHTDFNQVLNMWLRNIKDVHRIHRDELDQITDPEKKADRLVELNVIEQVQNLSKTSIVQKAWKHDNRPDLHGWVYGLKDGIINPVFEMKAGTQIDNLYKFDGI
jgi:carbonic anhydrase